MNIGLWDKLARVVVFLLFVAGVLAIAVWYLPLIRQNERMRKEVLRLEAVNQKDDEHGRQLKAAMDALRMDPRAIERVGRERYRLAKPGETIILFEPETNTPVIR